MKIGYPCINRTLSHLGNRTFRLKTYSESKLIETVENNLSYLLSMLMFNVSNQIFFFRVTSDLIPFASHPVCRFNWQDHFRERFKFIGNLLRQNDIRVSMHPDQFTLINSPDRRIFERSVRELLYHSEVLDCLDLDRSAKIQIHVGGVYGDKSLSVRRFMKRYEQLERRIRERLVIENDDRSYSLKDCMSISEKTGVPVLFDVFHHRILNHGETLDEAFDLFTRTWADVDGLPMVDYSTQQMDEKRGRHARSIDIEDFKIMLEQTKNYDFDLMLEVKDKEKSALKAIKAASNDPRLSINSGGGRRHNA